MILYPTLKLVFLNGFLLILPMLGLRYGIPALMNKKALAESDYFPPVVGPERWALYLYFASNTFLIFSPLLAEIRSTSAFNFYGWLFYLVGILVLAISLADFSRQKGLKKAGIYRYSRNPICLGYFFIFLGTSLLITSWFHLILSLIYQVAVHWLILSEERWCLDRYGESYQEYFTSVARYFII